MLYGCKSLGENRPVTIRNEINLAVVLFFAAALNLFAGGSGLNVVVIVNTNSTNSLQLGNYYCEKRGVPSENVLRINWTGGNTEWTRANFESVLRAPFTNMLAGRRLTNQIDYVVLSMDIPYRVSLTTGSTTTSGTNSTTSALHYGFKPDGCSSCPNGLPSCNLAPASDSDYANSESIFRQTPPLSATSNSWLVMMITSSNLAQARAIVDRGVMSDGSFPSQPSYIAKSYDYGRNIRYWLADDADFDTSVRGNYTVQLTNTYTSYGLGALLGFQNGVQFYNMAGSSFVPGAMADDLTSYSGNLFGSPDHTRVLDFISAGATASYGTVIEPCAYLAKFATPRNYFLQSRGFNIAECYYQSVTNPYQGILVGEPLAAPFAEPAAGQWLNPPDSAVIAGVTNLSFQFDADSIQRPIQQVDLFVDGLYAQTITNIPPRTNNVLYVTLNGVTTNFTIPANQTIKAVTSNLTARLNANAFASQTKVVASARGDRIELQSTNIAVKGVNLTTTTSNYIGTAAVRATYVSAARTNFLDTHAFGIRNFVVTNSPVNGTWLQVAITKTNGSVVTVAVTNSAGNADTSVLLQALANSINTNSSLTNVDGVIAEDVLSYLLFFGLPAAEFNLRSRSPGWPESQIQVVFTDSGPLTVLPSSSGRLDENVADLRPRNHLYVTAGLTNLPLTFGFNTTTQADGWHEFTVVAYEGSHVRTQKRISRTVRIANTNFSATFNVLNGGTNTALETTLQFSVVASTNTINRIELHTTGGLWSTVSNAQTANFSVPATNLHVGLHPFWGLAVRNDGRQYRTETKWLRIIGNEPPFSVGIGGAAPTLTWPATAGRHYEVLSATIVTNTYALRGAVTPTNSSGIWSETNNASSPRFYRVRSTQ